MKKKIIFVFHNGHKGGKLTRDCKIRIEAARQIASENQDAIVCFVGGGGICGAEDVQRYWQENYPELPNKIYLLKKANNTADAVKEIVEYLKHDSVEKENILISSDYHIKRIDFFAKRYKLDAKILAAEDVLAESKEFGDTMKKYRNSCAYLFKRAIEYIMLIYVRIDPDQKIVRLWREYKRS